MNRREILKTLLLGSASLPFLKSQKSSTIFGAKSKSTPDSQHMISKWTQWPDMEWIGPKFWGNRLQDWQLRDGKARCSVSAPNRTLHCLTHQSGNDTKRFATSADVELQTVSGSADDRVGFRLGAKAGNDPVPVLFTDYRRNAVFGEGTEAGVLGNGTLFIGNHKSNESLDLSKPIRLTVEAEQADDSYRITLTATDSDSGNVLDRINRSIAGKDALTGNFALLSHFTSEDAQTDSPSVLFSNWTISGDHLQTNPDQTFGPICFAQYTLDRGTLKMTAQLAPVENIERHKVALQIHQNGEWKTLQKTVVDPLSRTAHFRQKNWDEDDDIPYRIQLKLPLIDETRTFYYEGTIAPEPVSSDQLKSAVFSCNSHYGFPNREVVENVGKHRPDMAVFLGDQIYESHGGFGVQHSPVKKAALDWLRKWYMFGWSYREIFRHIPSAFIPDDHDVYHGNLWGETGKDAPVEKGWGYESQDEGGYKMPPEWVNMVQRAQTWNLPDPYDPTPVDQDISVYYTDWTYGGISFAIIEDRKFKSAPKNALPAEARVVNGFIQNREFDIKKQYDIDAELLGDRQLNFLEHWASDWSHGARMKAVLSQTNFCTLATLPEGSIIDEMVPDLPIPKRGDYVEGDDPTTDMDSNGWPQKGRDKALKTIRKGFALHIAGDQHLASTVQYGVDQYGDSGFAFAGPALNNIWPRRWWPPVDSDHNPLPGRPKNTGNFEDGFGNKMTVYAVGNPVQTNRKPGLVYDRATGYGIIIFDKKKRTMRIECWPRYVDPESNPEGQYDGWPVTVKQETNYGRNAAGYLPELQVTGLTEPVVQIYNEQTGELEYALRMKGNSFRPKIFDTESTYRLRIGEPDRNVWQEFLEIIPGDERALVCSF